MYVYVCVFSFLLFMIKKKGNNQSVKPYNLASKHEKAVRASDWDICA